MSESLLYDRQLLLLGPKRNSVLELWEIHRYGIDSYGDPDYVSIYGLRPDDWYAKGIRLLGLTAVECTRDDLAHEIGEDIAVIARKVSGLEPLVIDPFAGSGMTGVAAVMTVSSVPSETMATRPLFILSRI